MITNEIIKTITENGRLTTGTQEELENEFEFEASEQGLSDSEIQEAIVSGWFPNLINSNKFS